MKLSRRTLLTLSLVPLVPSIPITGKTELLSVVPPKYNIYGTHTGRISSEIPALLQVSRSPNTEEPVVRLFRSSPRVFDVSYLS